MIFLKDFGLFLVMFSDASTFCNSCEDVIAISLQLLDSVNSKKHELHIFRLVDADFRGPHLIYSVMGDELNPAHACFSYVGRVGGRGFNKGQVINLGSAACLAVGTTTRQPRFQVHHQLSTKVISPQQGCQKHFQCSW